MQGIPGIRPAQLCGCRTKSVILPVAEIITAPSGAWGIRQLPTLTAAYACIKQNRVLLSHHITYQHRHQLSPLIFKVDPGKAESELTRFDPLL